MNISTAPRAVQQLAPNNTARIAPGGENVVSGRVDFVAVGGAVYLLFGDDDTVTCDATTGQLLASGERVSYLIGPSTHYVHNSTASAGTLKITSGG